MKKFYTIFVLILLFISTNVFSQYYWNSFSLNTYENLNSVSCPDINTVYIGGNQGKIYKSINSGYTFSQKTFPNNGNITCIYFLNANTGFAGSQAGLFKTMDGGNNWSMITLPANYPVLSICFSSALTGWIGNWYGNILKTTDGGDTWLNMGLMTGYMSKVFFISDYNGWVVDNYGYVKRTTNGGTSYSQIRISYDTLSDIKFISSTIGYAVGDSGKVFKTMDGGSSWNALQTNITTNLYGLYLMTPLKIFACGENGFILSSEDGGITWTYENPVSVKYNSISFAPNTSSGIVVGNNGAAAHRISLPNILCAGTEMNKTGYPFYTYYMDSRTDMLYLNSEIVSNGGTPNGSISKIGFIVDSAYNSQVMNGFTILMKTTTATTITSFDNDGWTVVYNGNFSIPGTGPVFFDLTSPFVYTAGSNLLVEICFDNTTYTTNSFVQSTYMPGKTYHAHQDLVSGSGCFIASGSAQNYRPNMCFEVTTITNGNENQIGIPKEFSLSQNYPNPFNPVTKINYDLPKNSFVTIKIYDITGREIKTLVNETKRAGQYSIDFNGSNFASGVYFYRMQAGDFVSVKRMVMVK